MWASTSYDTNQNYGRAKFANMLFAQELAQRAPAGVVSTVAHPGLVLTTLFKELGPNYEPDSGGSLSGKSAVDDRLAGIPALKMLRDSTPLKVVLMSRMGPRLKCLISMSCSMPLSWTIVRIWPRSASS